MIQPEAQLKVADNTGAQKILCIRVLDGHQAKVGDMIVGIVKESFPNTAMQHSEIVRAVVVRIRKSVKRKNGNYMRFVDNAVVLVNKDGNPRGTRVFGPIARELREKNFGKIISLAPEVISVFL